MGKDIREAVREIAMAFPEVEETMTRGHTEYRVADKPFAWLTVNHHGDGRLALQVYSPPGVQTLCVDEDPEFYFVPPYVGPKGWLGMDLFKDPDWHVVALRTREAWVNRAPKRLVRLDPPAPAIDPPTETMDPEEFDPLVAPHAQERLAGLRERAMALPEVSEDTRFGDPVFCAGKKVFVNVNRRSRLQFSFWVGGEGQALLTADPRYCVPAYTGHNGWINLDVEDYVDWEEVDERLLESYRHFALKRMLKTLDAGLGEG